VVLRLE